MLPLNSLKLDSTITNQIFQALNSEDPARTQWIDKENLAAILNEDAATGYSHIYYEDQQVMGVVLARESQASFGNKAPGLKVVAVEHMHIAPKYRQHKLATLFLEQIAIKAVARGQDEIRSTVLKTNDAALRGVLAVGFEYVDKEFDEKWNAFLFKVKPKDLLVKIRPRSKL